MPREPSPVGRLLRHFSWAELRHHAWRHATAVLAVLLGVALAFSVHLINASALSEFSAAVRMVNGQADLSLRGAHGALDEALYPRVAGHPQVAVASPVVEVRTQVLDARGQAQSLRLVGLDPLVAAPLSPAMIPVLAQGVDRLALFAPDTVSLNPRARQLLGVAPGGTLRVQRGLGVVTLRVVGTVSAAGDALGVMDIAGAQTLLGRAGQISRLDVQLVGGARPASVLADLALPTGVVNDSPDEASQRVSNVSRAYRVNLTVLALVALFTGAFLVFSILSLSVSKRVPQLALLGVLGLSGRERQQLVLWESAAIGLVGSLGGLAAGTGLAWAALRWLGGDLGGGYFPGVTPALQWSPLAAATYGALGVAAAVVGGWLPARRAQRLAPAQGLKGLGEAMSGPRHPWVGPALMAASALLCLLPPVGGVPLWAYLGVAGLLMGGIASVPTVAGALLALWRAPRHAGALLAVERARRMRHTATVTMAGVVASLSLSVALTVMVASFRQSVSDWLDVVLPADLYARLAAETGAGQAPPVPREVLRLIAQLPGVARAEGLRLSTVTLQPGLPEVVLIARPVGEPQRTLPLVDTLVATPPPGPGEVAVYVSEAMVDLYGARPGTLLALPLTTTAPPVPARVRGVWRDYARQSGAIVMDEQDYRRLTGDHAVNNVALWLAPGARTAQVQTAVRRTLAAQGLPGDFAEFSDPGEIRQTTLRIFDRSFAVTYWLQAVAIGIGLFGTAASFSAQVLARRKEFGLLGHLGFTRRQVLAIVGGEGLALTGVGALMGLGLGLAVSVVLVHVVNPQSFHWTMDLMLPWGRLVALCLAVVAAGTLTAVAAGRQAAGRDAVMAVKEDW